MAEVNENPLDTVENTVKTLRDFEKNGARIEGVVLAVVWRDEKGEPQVGKAVNLINGIPLDSAAMLHYVLANTVQRLADLWDAFESEVEG